MNGCASSEVDMEVDTPGPLLSLHYVDLELDETEQNAVTGGQEFQSEDHCSFEPVRSGSELEEFVVGINRRSAHKGPRSTLLSLDITNLESPDCNLEARQLGPLAVVEMGELIRGSITVEIGYSCQQGIQGSYQIEVVSSGKIVAQDGRCAMVSESLAQAPVSF